MRYDFDEASSESASDFDYSSFSPSALPGTLSAPGRGDLSGVSSDLQALASDAPLDENLYIVGPGDLFQIFVESNALEKRVTPEGQIILNRIGAVTLEGLTLKEAKKKLLDKLQTAYKRTNCFVALSQPRIVRIAVAGAVAYPGIYEMPGNYRMTDAIRRAGGYTGQAQKGMIEIVADGRTETIDTKEFLINGNIEANPYVCQSCVLKVPYVDFSKPWVTVRRDSVTMYVPVAEGENAYDLIMKAYSFRPNVVFSTVAITELDGSSSTLSPAELRGYKPKSEAVLEVSTERHELFVGGAVQLPGFQKYRPGRKVSEYISQAGLNHTSKVSKNITVIRKDGKKQSLPLQSTNLFPGDVLLVQQNLEQKFLIYTPILLSVVSLALVYMQVSQQ